MRTLHEPWQRELVRRYFAQLSRERRTERLSVQRQPRAAETVRYGVDCRRYIDDLPTTRQKRKMTIRLAREQGGLCYLCNRRFGDGALRPTLDHVVPRDHGGRTAGNILAAHSRCNNVKANRAPTRAEMLVLAQINEALGPDPWRDLIRPMSQEERAVWMEWAGVAIEPSPVFVAQVAAGVNAKDSRRASGLTKAQFLALERDQASTAASGPDCG